MAETQEERFDRIVAEQLAEKEAQEATPTPDPRKRVKRGESAVSRQLRQMKAKREAEEAAEAARRLADAEAVSSDEAAAGDKDRGFFERFLPSDIGNVLDAKRSADIVEVIDPANETTERQKAAQTTDSQN